MQVQIHLLWHFVGDKLAARMALLDKGEVEETYFPDCDDYILLWKLEVLENIKVVAMLKAYRFC